MLTTQLAQVTKLFTSKNGLWEEKICHLGGLSARQRKFCINIIICLLIGSFTFVVLQ